MADQEPLFTVFTPTYNRAGILARAYESLRRQTLRDFEWLVIDDGSTDNTREVVEGWQREADFPIRYAWQENGNKAAAWNHALVLAQGKFFICLDSDDECVPEALESFKSIWESIPPGERGRFSGVTVLALDQDGRFYGPDLPKSPVDCSPLGITFRIKGVRDNWQCYLSAIIKQYPFELIPGYRNYIPQSVGINRIATAYIQRHVNHRLLIIHTDHEGDSAGHLSCGITARASLKHALGYRVANLTYLKYQIGWFPYAPARFYKLAANYVRFSWMQSISMRSQLKELGSMRARALWLAALPAGAALRLNDRRIKRRAKPAQTLDTPRPAVLYITYDGLLEGLGQSQVLPYLRELAGEFAITVLSFEKPQDLANLKRRQGLQERLDRAAITWIPLRYHKRPSLLATAFDIVHGAVRGVGAAMRRKPEIVHVRGYVPGVIGLALKSVTGARFIFDMRGFWPEEKVDAGAWQRDSSVFRAAKWVEQKLLQRADVVVSLTLAGVNELRKYPYLRGRDVRFEVIPTCADLALFRPSGQRNGHERRGFVLGYVGSVGTFYLFDEVLECFRELLKERTDVRLLAVNRGAHGYIHERIKALGIPADWVELHSAEHHEVPEYLRQMDAGAFFIKPTFSKKSSAPTRLGEFLGCGVPCLINAGVGDMDSVVSHEHVGVVMREFSPEARRTAVRELLALCADEGTRTRCVRAARQHFSLEQGVAAYRKIYRGLGNAEPESDSQKRGIEYEREFSHQ